MVTRLARSAALLVVAMATMSGCDKADPAVTDAACVQPNGTAAGPTATSPAGGMSLVVAETGFTRLPYAPFVLVGALIENPNDQIAYGTTVTVTVRAADGTELADATAAQQRRQVIPVIMPHSSIGFGAAIGQPPADTIIPPASLTVDIGPSSWAPEAAYATTEVTALTADTNSVGNPHGGITFTLDAGYCQETPSRGVATLYRDGTGKLIGGSVNAPFPAECPAQPSTVHVSLPMMPAAADPTRITAYPYCDPTASA